MIERKIDRQRKYLEDKIRIYNKNNKALCDLLAFYSQIIKEENENIILLSLFETLIKDLEDEEVDIPLRAENIENLFLNETEKYYKTMREIKKFDDSELFDSLNEDYRMVHIFADKKLMNALFDFIKLLTKHLDLIHKLLMSDINISKKVDIFYNIILALIENFNVVDLKKILIPHNKIENQKIKELKLNFKSRIKNKVAWDKEKRLLNTVISSSNPQAWLVYLQKEGLIDFTDAYFNNISRTNEKHLPTFCCTFLKIEEGLNYFSEVYQLPDYLNEPKFIRENTDLVILERIPIEEIANFILLSNFKVTEEKIIVIAQRILEYQKEQNIINNEMRNKIADTIIHKAKNKEEYKKMDLYAKQFMQLSDYKLVLKQIEEEKKSLASKRAELSTILYNMNEAAQESGSSRRLVQEITFVQKSKK